MGLCRLPGDKVVAALAAIDTLMFFHLSVSPDRFIGPIYWYATRYQGGVKISI
jgi:hypothetical protein